MRKIVKEILHMDKNEINESNVFTLYGNAHIIYIEEDDEYEVTLRNQKCFISMWMTEEEMITLMKLVLVTTNLDIIFSI